MLASHVGARTACAHARESVPGGGVLRALSGLYPAVSTLLARGFLTERLRAVQIGVIAALTGVLLLNA
jgi:drug/metabolite transporter (DMT)-like permease